MKKRYIAARHYFRWTKEHSIVVGVERKVCCKREIIGNTRKRSGNVQKNCEKRKSVIEIEKKLRVQGLEESQQTIGGGQREVSTRT